MTVEDERKDSIVRNVAQEPGVGTFGTHRCYLGSELLAARNHELDIRHRADDVNRGKDEAAWMEVSQIEDGQRFRRRRRVHVDHEIGIIGNDEGVPA